MRLYLVRNSAPVMDGLLGLTKRGVVTIHCALVDRAEKHPIPSGSLVMRDDDGHEIFMVFSSSRGG